MCNLTNHAKRELEIIGAFDEDGDYGGMIGVAVMELMELFSEQGHSGYSAGCVRSLFEKLADFKPLSPLRFTDDEWNECHGYETETYQNNRNSAVFKEGLDGRPYHIDAFVLYNEEVNSWHGSLMLDNGKRVGRCYIKYSANMPTVKITVPITHHVRDGKKDSWDFDPAPVTALKELQELYDVDLIDIDERE